MKIVNIALCCVLFCLSTQRSAYCIPDLTAIGTGLDALKELIPLPEKRGKVTEAVSHAMSDAAFTRQDLSALKTTKTTDYVADLQEYMSTHIPLFKPNPLTSSQIKKGVAALKALFANEDQQEYVLLAVKQAISSSYEGLPVPPTSTLHTEINAVISNNTDVKSSRNTNNTNINESSSDNNSTATTLNTSGSNATTTLANRTEFIINSKSNATSSSIVVHAINSNNTNNNTNTTQISTSNITTIIPPDTKNITMHQNSLKNSLNATASSIPNIRANETKLLRNETFASSSSDGVNTTVTNTTVTSESDLTPSVVSTQITSSSQPTSEQKYHHYQHHIHAVCVWLGIASAIITMILCMYFYYRRYIYIERKIDESDLYERLYGEDDLSPDEKV